MCAWRKQRTRLIVRCLNCSGSFQGNTVALLLLIYPLVEGREAGWPDWAFAMMGAAIAAFFAFIAYERWVVRRGHTPLIALHLFRVPTIAFGLAIGQRSRW
jgi:hypothetical protein